MNWDELARRPLTFDVDSIVITERTERAERFLPCHLAPVSYIGFKVGGGDEENYKFVGKGSIRLVETETQTERVREKRQHRREGRRSSREKRVETQNARVKRHSTPHRDTHTRSVIQLD